MKGIFENKKEGLLFLLISFYITFSFVGYPIFLPLDKTAVSITDILAFVVAWGLFSVALAALIKGRWWKQGFKKLEDTLWELGKKPGLVKTVIGLDLIFIVYCLIQLVTAESILKDIEFYKLYAFLWMIAAGVIWLAVKIWKDKPVSVFEQSVFMLMAVFFPVALVCYPGCLSSDSIDQITQCSTLVFSDHHPFLHTFFEKVLLLLINNVMFITVVQVLVYVFVAARWMTYFIKRGLRKSLVFIISAAITLYPSTLSLVVTLWKDTLFSIGLLWLSLLLAEYISDEIRFKKVRYWIEIFCACILAGTFRHNGALIMLGMMLVVLILHFTNKVCYSWKQTLLFIFCIILIFAGKTALFHKWNVSPNGSLASIIPIHGMAYEIYMGEELPEDVMAYMDEFMPVELLKEKYYAYSANSYMYDAEAIEHGTMDKLRQSDIPEVISLYLKTLAVNPYYLIKDRLYGTDTLWNVFGGDGSYTYAYDFYIPPNTLGISRFENVFQKVFSLYTKVGRLLPFIFYRAGLYLDILLIAFYCAVRKKNYRIFLVSAPLLLNVASLMLSMAWQDFRYVWFVQLIVPFLVMYYWTETKNTMDS